MINLLLGAVCVAASTLRGPCQREEKPGLPAKANRGILDVDEASERMQWLEGLRAE